MASSSAAARARSSASPSFSGRPRRARSPSAESLRHRGERARRDAVAARQRHDLLDGRKPVGPPDLGVPTELPRGRERLEPHPQRGRQPGLEGFAQQVRLVGREDIDARREAGVERELLHEPKADGVDRAQVRERQRLRALVGARLDERPADARAEFDGRLPCVGDGDELLRRDGALGAEGLKHLLREAVRLAASGARADESERLLA